MIEGELPSQVESSQGSTEPSEIRDTGASAGSPRQSEERAGKTSGRTAAGSAAECPDRPHDSQDSETGTARPRAGYRPGAMGEPEGIRPARAPGQGDCRVSGVAAAGRVLAYVT
jgi:hypothetical protein